MPDTSTLIPLAHAEPLASGGSRLIYQHPWQPELLIKVVKYGVAARGDGLRAPVCLKARFQVTRQLRELREHIRVLGNPDDPLAQHLPAMAGIVTTDLGFGLTVEAIRGADGRLAPTLSRLMGECRLQPHHRMLLETFFEHLLASPAIVGDLSRNNLVLGRDVRGNDYFALVDGLGDATLVPMYALVPGRNRLKKQRARRRILAALDSALG
jgi:hypothetical protein